VNLKYNYADLAKEIFSKLLVLYDKFTKFFKNLHITKKNIVDALNDLEKYLVISTYNKIPQLYKQERYIEAGGLAGALLMDYNEDPTKFNKVGINEDRLLIDAGVAFFKASEEAEKRGVAKNDINNLLGISKKYLLNVKATDYDFVQRKLFVIDSKMNHF
jgi:hypothetical protein